MYRLNKILKKNSISLNSCKTYDLFKKAERKEEQIFKGTSHPKNKIIKSCNEMKLKRMKSGVKLRFSTRDNVQVTKSCKNDSLQFHNMQCKPEKIKELNTKI